MLAIFPGAATHRAADAGRTTAFGAFEFLRNAPRTKRVGQTQPYNFCNSLRLIFLFQ